MDRVSSSRPGLRPASTAEGSPPAPAPAAAHRPVAGGIAGGGPSPSRDLLPEGLSYADLNHSPGSAIP
jgi:hypothetical protein